MAAQILTIRFATAARTFFVLAAAALLSGCATNSYNWGWYVVSPFDPRGQKNLAFLANGMAATLTLSGVAIAISMALGAALAVAGMTRYRALRWTNRVYVEVFRAIPVLVLLLWVYYGLPVVAGIQFTVFVAGAITLALSDAAFES